MFMFTGLVETVGEVVSIRGESGGRIIRIHQEVAPTLEVGESIAVQGVCLTVSKVIGKDFEIHISSRTQAKTNLLKVSVGKKVNLERALRLGDRIGGHLVQGHIDGIGKILGLKRKNGSVTFNIKVPSELSKFLVANGSVAVDGVSLTIGDVKNKYFEVGLIPYTLLHTTLGNLRIGDEVHLEVDIIGKYLR